MAEIAAGIGAVAENVVEGMILVAKGIYDGTLPLNAKLHPIQSVKVPLAYHTVSVVKGRAYLFGGKTLSKDGGLELASNDMHTVILPSSGIESVDYKMIEATNNTPPKRYGHSAAVIDDRIYVFGGNGGETPLDENGRVWVYDTTSNKWTHLDPPEKSSKPDSRASHASVASEYPRPANQKPDEDILPQQPPDPETVMPEIPDANSYGTLIIQGGQAGSGNNFVDIWSFDISTRMWAQLPDLPGPSAPSPSLALLDQRLYAFSAGQISFFDLTKGEYDDIHGRGELGIAPVGPWKSLPPTSSAPEKKHPGERTEASMVPITTGQGRNYLLLVGGKSQSGEQLEDVWVYQLKPEGMTAASFKDAARMAIKMNTKEAEWMEVKYHDDNGVMIQEGQLGRGIGVRKGFAASADTEIDGSTVLLWGGLGPDDNPRGDGLKITIDV